MKPAASYYGSQEEFEAKFSELFFDDQVGDLIMGNDQFIGDYCMHHYFGTGQCEAGVKELSIDAAGKLGICPFSPHTVDVSTPQLFAEYVTGKLPNNELIGHCSLIGGPGLPE